MAQLTASSRNALLQSAIALLLVGVFFPSAASAQARSLELERFHSEIQVQEDGSLLVRETLTARFTGAWNGLERELSLNHETAEGRRARLRIELGEITDDQGRPLEVERSGSRNALALRIWVPDAVDATRTVVIPYRVEGAIRFFEEDGPGGEGGWEELYYNVTGNDWRIPIRSAEARVTLPPGVETTGVWGYTGPSGSTEQAVEVDSGGGEAAVRTTRSLGSGEGLTISVTWPPGGVERSAASSLAGNRLLAHWPLGLPLVALAAMLRTWVRRGRDPRGHNPGRVEVVEYSPPEGLTPAEVGTLVDHKAEMHDITATLVDLAVRGYLRIEELEAERGFLGLGGRKEDWAFHQLRPRSDWNELKEHEKAYLEGLFEPALKTSAGFKGAGEAFQYMGDSFRAWRQARREGEDFDAHTYMKEWIRAQREEEDEEGETLSTVKLSELENNFYTHLAGIRTAIYMELKKEGLYARRPDHQVQRWSFFGGVFLVAAVIIGIVLSNAYTLAHLLPAPFSAAFGLGLSGLVVLVVAQGMGVRTEEGARALDRIQGFREFLSRVESDYYDRVVDTPELFEAYLAHAIALKVDQRWAKAFDGIYREAPDWYQGTSGSTFRATTFASSMNRLSTQAGRSMASSPSSSGSGGGGSSGGGSGGGGGGGF